MTGGGKSPDILCPECGGVFGGGVTYDRHIGPDVRCLSGDELRAMDIHLFGGVWRQVVVSRPMLDVLTEKV